MVNKMACKICHWNIVIISNSDASINYCVKKKNDSVYSSKII